MPARRSERRGPLVSASARSIIASGASVRRSYSHAIPALQEEAAELIAGLVLSGKS